MQILFQILFVLALLALNAVLAAYEMALSSVSHARLLALEKAGRRGAAAAVAMKARIEASFAVIQLGVTLLAAVAGAYGGAAVEEQLTPVLRAEWGLSDGAADAVALSLLVIPLSALTIVLGELAPKVIALRHREQVCLALSPAMQAIARAGAPLVFVLEKAASLVVAVVSRRRAGRKAEDDASLHELMAAAALARTARVIGPREERIVRSAAQLSSRPVRDIVLPAADISMLPIGATLEQSLVQAHLDMHTRFPVCRVEGDPQTIEGYVTFKDLVTLLKVADGTPGLKPILRPLKRIAATQRISQALDEMVRERQHIALVVEEGDRVVGIITLEDIVEELVGDIEDEFDRLPAHVQPAGDGVIAGGGAPFGTVLRQLGIAPAGGGDSTTRDTAARPFTVADWVAQRLTGGLKGGEVVTGVGVQVLVRKLRRKRVAEAFVRRSPAA